MRLPTGGFESRAAITRRRAEPLRRGRSRRRFAARDETWRRDRPGEPPATTRRARTGEDRRARPSEMARRRPATGRRPFWCDASDVSNAPVASDVAAVKRCASLKRVSTRFRPVCHRGYSRTRDISPILGRSHRFAGRNVEKSFLSAPPIVHQPELARRVGSLTTGSGLERPSGGDERRCRRSRRF